MSRKSRSGPRRPARGSLRRRVIAAGQPAPPGSNCPLVPPFKVPSRWNHRRGPPYSASRARGRPSEQCSEFREGGGPEGGGPRPLAAPAIAARRRPEGPCHPSNPQGAFPPFRVSSVRDPPRTPVLIRHSHAAESGSEFLNRGGPQGALPGASRRAACGRLAGAARPPCRARPPGFPPGVRTPYRKHLGHPGPVNAIARS
jgi:hypothetical protein